MNERDHTKGTRNNRDLSKVTMKNRDHSGAEGMRISSNAQEECFQEKIITLRAQIMVLSGIGIVPRAQGIVKRNEVYSS